MSNTDTPRDLEVVYVDTSNLQYYGRLHAYLSDEVTIAELVAAAEFLESLPQVASVEPYFDGKAAALRINSVRGELTSKEEAELMELLSPEFTRKVTAEAVVQRNKDGVHESTRISVHVTAGDNLAGFNKDRSHDNRDGAQRVRVIGRAATTVIFLMQEPAANDDDGAITEVVEKMAETLGAMLAKPVVVNEPDEYAALDKSKDYQPATPAR